MEDYQDISPHKFEEGIDENITTSLTHRDYSAFKIMNPNNLSVFRERSRSLSPLSEKLYSSSTQGTPNSKLLPPLKISREPSPRDDIQNRSSNDFKPIVHDPTADDISNTECVPTFGIEIQEVLSQRQSVTSFPDQSEAPINSIVGK